MPKDYNNKMKKQYVSENYKSSMDKFNLKIYGSKTGQLISIVTRRQSERYQCTFYDCNLCHVYNVIGRDSINMHLNGRKHKENWRQYQITYGISSKSTRCRDASLYHNHDCYPPKPVLVDILRNRAELGIVGLEYIVELIKDHSMKINYRCILCQTGDCRQQSTLLHLISISHRNRFLNKHFPKAQNFLDSFNLDLDDARAAVQYGCERVEAFFGRSEPFQCNYDYYHGNRYEIQHRILNGNHFTEYNKGYWFNVYDKAFIKQLLKKSGENNSNERYAERNVENYISSLGYVENNFWSEVYNKSPKYKHLFRYRSRSPFKITQHASTPQNSNIRNLSSTAVQHLENPIFSRNSNLRSYKSRYYSSPTLYSRKKSDSKPSFNESPVTPRKRRRSPSTAIPTQIKRSRSSISQESDSKPDLIAICRTLMVLETFTGSLNSKVMHLMGEALTMDKIEGKSCIKMVTKSDNWVLMQTVREKLKGHLMNQLVTETYRPIVEKVVVCIKDLLAEYPMKSQNKKRDSTTKIVQDSSGNLSPFISESSSKDFKEEIVDNEQLLNKKMDSFTVENARDIQVVISSESCHKDDDYLGEIKKLEPETVTADVLEIFLEKFEKMSVQARLGLVELLKTIQLTDPGRVDGFEKYLLINDGQYDNDDA